MANSTLLQLITDACGEMGNPAIPTTVVGNQTTNAIQLLAQANAAGNMLAREYQWQASTVEYRFTTQYLDTTGTRTTSAATVTLIPTTAALAAGTWMATGTGIPQDTYIFSVDSATQVTLTNTPTIASTGAILFSQTKYTMPSDFDRLIDRTDWDKSQHWELLGPETAQQWQWLKSGYIATGPRVRFRPLGGYFQTWPPLSSNDQMGFEYQSKYWIYATGAAAVSKARFTVDTDTCIFPDRLMVAAIKKAYYGSKGFAPAWDNEYATQLELAKAHDAGSKTLSMMARGGEQLISTANLPESGYGP